MAGHVDLVLRVTPRAARAGIDGVDEEGRLRVRVTAPPVDGAANEAVMTLLASELGVRRGSVALLAGSTGRLKRVRLDGLEETAVLARWPGVRLGAGG
jgi:uncharacterized protein (TIGR00251 family)